MVVPATTQGGVFNLAQLGHIAMLLILLPSFPGIETPHRRAEQTNPCERRRFREQPTSQSGIDHSFDKVEVPRNLPRVVQRHVAEWCHVSPSMRLVMSHDQRMGCLRHVTSQHVACRSIDSSSRNVMAPSFLQVAPPLALAGFLGFPK